MKVIASWNAIDQEAHNNTVSKPYYWFKLLHHYLNTYLENSLCIVLSPLILKAWISNLIGNSM